MLKLVESRLSQEKDNILSQQQTQNVLLTNLQTIQVQEFIYDFFQTSSFQNFSEL